MNTNQENNEPSVKYRSQRVKKPSNRQLIYETNFDEKVDSPKRKYRRRKKKFEKMKMKEKKIKKTAGSTNLNKVIISNSNITIENNQNIYICLDENFKQPETLGIKKKLRFFNFAPFINFVIIFFFQAKLNPKNF